MANKPPKPIGDSILERGLPSSVDTERLVLGAIQIDPSRLEVVSGIIEPSDFSLRKHQVIFQRMKDISDRGERPDRVVLANELVRNGELEMIDGLQYIVSLDEGLPEIVAIDAYARIVKEKADLRHLIFRSQQAIEQALSELAPARDIAAAATESLSSIQAGPKTEDQGQTIEQVVDAYPGGAAAFLDPSQRKRGLLSGLRRLDDMTDGFHDGELVVIAGRPGTGKSSLLGNICENVCLRRSKPEAWIFSLEMVASSLVSRIVCSMARVDQHKFRAGFVKTEERQALQRSLFSLTESNLKIVDHFGISIGEICKIVRRESKKSKIACVGIDYLQLAASKSKSENRNLEISEMTRQLKILAGECELPVLLLSQLSRSNEKRTGSKKPILSDLRDSGCVHGGSLVVLADGSRRRIEDLVGKDGLVVLGMGQDDLKVKPFHVSNVFKSGHRPVLRMKTQTGREVIATANHKFRTISGWKRLDQLQAREHIAVPRTLPSDGVPTMSKDELALLGHIIGNGSVLNGQPAHYTTFDRDVADVVGETARRIFGTDVNPHVEPTRGHWDLYFNSTKTHTHRVFSELRLFLERFGLWDKRSLVKFIPEEVFSQSNFGLRWFVGNLWSTDGCIMPPGKNGVPVAYYSTSSERLARDVQFALSRLGVRSRIKALPQKLSPRPNWHVTISGKADLMLFCELPAIGKRRQGRLRKLKEHLDAVTPNTNLDVVPSQAWKTIVKPAFKKLGMTDRSFQEGMGWKYSGSTRYKHGLGRDHAGKIAEFVDSEDLRVLAQSDLYWDRIVSIEPAGEVDVYDMTVPGCSNFIADNIIAHNSIEQDADTVIFIHREEFYSDKEEHRGVADLIVAKQRHGPLGTAEVRFIGGLTRFENKNADDMPGENDQRDDEPPPMAPSPSQDEW